MVDGPNPRTVTLSRNPVYGSYCGTYQDDFTIKSIDGSTNCHYGNPNASILGQPSPGGAVLCQTDNVCVLPTPTPTPNLGNCGSTGQYTCSINAPRLRHRLFLRVLFREVPVELLRQTRMSQEEQQYIAGSVVVNAGLTGGSLTNNRNVCAENAQCPSFSITQRPDLLINTPAFLTYTNHIWKEVAPH